ncbi:MAG: ThiF family adenylyltransferase [Lachnospiraceae bacterium]|nr:ThiF family adenylyltransferase [Lachnospiraceae bacterium]
MKRLFYNIIIVGVGGTGGLLANFLCKTLAKRTDVCITLVDADVVEAKNLVRQPYMEEDIGACKSEALAEALQDAYDVSVISEGIFIESAEDISSMFYHAKDVFRMENNIENYRDDFNEVKILCGCVDNHAARKCMHDYFTGNYSRAYDYGTPLLYADSGNEFNYGEVVFGLCKGKEVVAPDKVHYFPDLFDGELTPRSQESCEALNESAPQHFTTNLMAATIMLSGISRLIQTGVFPTGIVNFDSGITGSFRMSAFPYQVEKNSKEKGVRKHAKK